MNYKKIIKNKKLRSVLIKSMSFVPDKVMIKIQYYIKFGRKLDLKEPKRYTEKMQWYKLYYRNPLMKKCCDKYDVREYVKKCGFEDILVPLVGVYENAEQIDIDNLRHNVVIKDTLGGGGYSVIVYDEKNEINKEQLFLVMRKWIKSSTSYKVYGREWAYGGKKHRIIIEEKLLSNENEGGLIDYKIFCFNGKAELVYVLCDRVVGGDVGLGIYNSKFERLSVNYGCAEKTKPLERNICKPEKWDEMIEISEKLATPFPQVRIDLYYVRNQIYFGEMTFYDGSGYMQYDPDTFDYELGKKFVLPDFDSKYYEFENNI